MSLEEQRLAFGSAADLYDEVRPGYPAEALRWIVGDAAAQVVDLGAGTGLLARGLHSLGHRVIAVEPDPAMRARLTAKSPQMVVLAGSAEAIPLPDGSADIVVAGQAYHWFDPAPSHAEIARVLRPGGIFAPVWNIRDASVPWVAELSALVPAQARTGRSNMVADGQFGARFGPIEHAVFAHAQTHTTVSLIELIRSRSYYLTANAPTREGLEAAVCAITDPLPEVFPLPYLTHAYRAATVTE
jgi:SAM-dependent methyltransferase